MKWFYDQVRIIFQSKSSQFHQLHILHITCNYHYQQNDISLRESIDDIYFMVLICKLMAVWHVQWPMND